MHDHLEGCIGSMDDTNFYWNRCPKHLKNSYTGKTKTTKPTIAYQVVVDHNRRIHHVSNGFEGAWNDKPRIQYEGYSRRLIKVLIFLDYTEYLKIDCLINQWTFSLGRGKHFEMSVSLSTLRRDGNLFFKVCMSSWIGDIPNNRASSILMCNGMILAPSDGVNGRKLFGKTSSVVLVYWNHGPRRRTLRNAVIFKDKENYWLYIQNCMSSSQSYLDSWW